MNWTTQPTKPEYDPYTDADLKERFVRAWLREPDTFKAALSVLPSSNPRTTGWALHISSEWPDDPEVLELKADILEEEGEDEFLPTKAELAKRVYERAEETRNPDDAQKLYKLYAEIRGFIEKPGTTINNNNSVQPTVMVVRDHGTNEEWEQKLAEMQNKLVANA